MALDVIYRLSEILDLERASGMFLHCAGLDDQRPSGTHKLQCYPGLVYEFLNPDLESCVSRDSLQTSQVGGQGHGRGQAQTSPSAEWHWSVEMRRTESNAEKVNNAAQNQQSSADRNGSGVTEVSVRIKVWFWRRAAGGTFLISERSAIFSICSSSPTHMHGYSRQKSTHSSVRF
jgi:hypothetical protein